RFDRERVTSFEFRYHFASVDAWLAYMAEHWASASIAPAQVTRARELLSAEGAALVIREWVHAARYRRGRAPEDVREASRHFVHGLKVVWMQRVIPTSWLGAALEAHILIRRDRGEMARDR